MPLRVLQWCVCITGRKQPSFTIEHGKKTALVGSSGSGKSTITKLLLKYYVPENGKITIDEMNIREISAQYLRENISLVPQNIQLFSKSIFENVAMVKPNATEKEVAEALRLAKHECGIIRF